MGRKWARSVLGELAHVRLKYVFALVGVVCGLLLMRWAVVGGVGGGRGGGAVSTGNGCALETSRRMRRRGKPVALAMMEGTGEVWVREMVERVTQWSTSSPRCDESLVKMGFKDECSDPQLTAMALTYRPIETASEPVDYLSAVYIPRNPFDSIAARYLAQVGREEQDTLVQLPFDFVVEAARTYKQHYLFWTRSSNLKTLTLRFEDLKREPAAHLGRVAMFLGAVVNDSRLLCAIGADEAVAEQFQAQGEEDGPLREARRYGGRLFFASYFFDPTARSFVLEYLRDELCSLGYFYDLKELECGVEWERLENERRATNDELEEERERLARRDSAAAERPHKFAASLRNRWRRSHPTTPTTTTTSTTTST